MATKILSYQEIIEQARNTWNGKIGNERAEEVKRILDTRLENYSRITGLSFETILKILEKDRIANTVNYYQESNLPLIEQTKDLFVFNTLNDYLKVFPSRKFICPKCQQETAHENYCGRIGCKYFLDSFFKIGTIQILIIDRFKTKPRPILIFKPIEYKETGEK